MTAYHEFYTLVGEQFFQPRGIPAGIASDMREEHLNSFRFKDETFVASTPHFTVVDISANGSHDRDDILKISHNRHIADIAGMPHFITTAEMDGKAVVPQRVGVAQNAYFLHPTVLFILRATGTLQNCCIERSDSGKVNDVAHRSVDGDEVHRFVQSHLNRADSLAETHFEHHTVCS